MYSYRQLYDLHRVINNNSEVHDRLTQCENDIKRNFTDIDAIKETIKALRAYTDNTINEFKQ